MNNLQDNQKSDATSMGYDTLLPTVNLHRELKRGDIFKSLINGKKWEVYETTLGKKIKLISGLKNEDYWLHMYIGYVMKAVKKGTKFEDTYEILNCG